MSVHYIEPASRQQLPQGCYPVVPIATQGARSDAERRKFRYKLRLVWTHVTNFDGERVTANQARERHEKTLGTAGAQSFDEPKDAEGRNLGRVLISHALIMDHGRPTSICKRVPR